MWVPQAVFATALIPVDKKEIMDIFRNLLFAPNQTVFDSKLPEWYGLIQGIQVKVKAGAGSEWIQLSDYYDKKWAPMVDMWAMYPWKRLPIGGENTNNRLERLWRSVKDNLDLLHVSKVGTARALMECVQWAESKLVTACTQARRKKMQIFDSDPYFQQIYREAADTLTEPGCLLLRTSIKKLQKYKSFLALAEGGVKEILKEWVWGWTWKIKVLFYNWFQL